MNIKRSILFLFAIAFPLILSAQGNVGVGTSTPQEKLDVNGAMIIRGSGVAATPVPGTIRWNSTDGYHEGRTGAGTYIKLENDEISSTGDYTTVFGCSYPATIGNNEYTTDATGYFIWETPNFIENPFGTWWEDDRTQLLYHGSMLSDAGVCAGDISAIGFYVVTPGALTMNTFTIKMTTTNVTSLTGYITGLTTVYTAASFYPTVGANDFTLTTPIYWDGSDNIVIEVCYDNNAWSTGCTVSGDQNVGYNSAVGYYSDLPFASNCATATTYFVDDLPQLRVFGPPPTPVTGTDTYYQFNDAIVVGSPVLFYGADYHGAGTVTAEGIYDDNTLLSDFVFDEYFDGKVKEEDFNNCYEYRYLTLNELKDFISAYRHLPNIPGRDEWNESGPFSVGELLTGLWVSAEDQALYLKEIYDRSESMQKAIVKNKAIIQNKLLEGIELIKADEHISNTTKEKKIKEMREMILQLEQM